MLDGAFEAVFAFIGWLIYEIVLEVIFELIFLKLIKIAWSCLTFSCWVIGATLVFLFTLGTIYPLSKDLPQMKRNTRSFTIYQRKQKRYLEYNIVTFIGASCLTIFAIASFA